MVSEEKVAVWNDSRKEIKKEDLPSEENPKSHEVENGYQSKSDGVYFSPGDGEPLVWLCSPLEVVALTRNEGGKDWGKLLKVVDRDSNTHEVTMPEDLLDGDEYRKRLRSLGLRIASGKIHGRDPKQRLYDYLNEADPTARAKCVNSLGWHDGCFVFPEKTIDDNPNERTVYQSMTIPEGFKSRGSLDDWQNSIAKMSQGNSRLVLVLSTAFACPLLLPTGHENGGVHLQGGSSLGKTTALNCGNSVYGGPEDKKNWRTTDNGLESVCFERNDLLLTLDEINQVDPAKAGDIAYMIGNGAGKTRSKTNGDSRPVKKFRLLYISTGEVDLATQMSKAGHDKTAGQEVRLVQLNANTGSGYGLFEDLHGYAGGAEFSQALNEAANNFYGTAGYVFIEKLIENGINTDRVKELMGEFGSSINLGEGADGQVKRVAERFALIASAGELATEYGVTGWDSGEALRAAKVCFEDWVKHRGGTKSFEEMEALNKVAEFLQGQEHRFKPILSENENDIESLTSPDDSKIIRDQVGYIRRHQGRTQWLCYKEAFRKDVCSGSDSKVVLKALKDKGAIEEKSVRLKNMSPRKYFIFNEKLFDL